MTPDAPTCRQSSNFFNKISTYGVICVIMLHTMKCPRCYVDNDKVLESRTNKDGTSIRRRRECLNCGHRFTSYERIEEKPIIVIKKDGSEQPFDISKIERGVRTCTEKLRLSQGTIEKLLNSIEDEIYKKTEHTRKITSIEIGETTLKELYKVSKVAYVRFASVYREFDDVNKFINEIENIAKTVGEEESD